MTDAIGLWVTAWVGSYCDQYVWVAPRYHDQLAKLTFGILDFAVNDAAQGPVKTVKLFLASDGSATTEAKASQVVETIVSTDVNEVSDLSVSNSGKKPATVKSFEKSEMIQEGSTSSPLRAYPGLEFKERLDAFR